MNINYILIVTQGCGVFNTVGKHWWFEVLSRRLTRKAMCALTVNEHSLVGELYVRCLVWVVYQ